MKTTIKRVITEEVDIDVVKICVPVRYEAEDIPPKITLRDQLAFQAMSQASVMGYTNPVDIVMVAYQLADAILAARGKQAEEKICVWTLKGGLTSSHPITVTSQNTVMNAVKEETK